MTTAIPTRSLRLLVTAPITLACSASSVWANSIVLRNRSGAGGNVLISEAGEPIARADFSSPPAPTTGVFTFGDTATASARGASSTFTADITTSISPSRFTAQGNLSAVAFTYSGRFLLEREANFSGLLVPLGTHVIEHAGVIGPGTSAGARRALGKIAEASCPEN